MAAKNIVPGSPGTHFIHMRINLSSFGLLALCIMASPSSLYNLTLLVPKMGLILFRKYNPTSSHTSALSKLFIVILDNGFRAVFTQPPLSSSNKDFLSWFMMLVIFPSISIKDFAKVADLSSSSVEIEG